LLIPALHYPTLQRPELTKINQEKHPVTGFALASAMNEHFIQFNDE